MQARWVYTSYCYMHDWQQSHAPGVHGSPAADSPVHLIYTCNCIGACEVAYYNVHTQLNEEVKICFTNA